MADSLATVTAPPTVEVIYDEALAFMERLHQAVTAGQPIPAAEVLHIADRLLEATQTHQPKLVGLTVRSSFPQFLFGHSVNTSILAMVIAKALQYAETVVRDVGAAALLHDLGLTKAVNGAEPRTVKYHDMRGHAYECLALLGDIPEFTQLIVYLDSLEPRASETATTTSPPRELTVAERELSKVVRLADLYEALTHPRADRPTVLAFPAVRTILKTQHLFEPRLVKALFDQVGIYPLNTWVRLNTGEMGRVTAIHKGLPLRPQVAIHYDRAGGRLPEERSVDLAQHPLYFVKESLAEEPLPRRMRAA